MIQYPSNLPEPLIESTQNWDTGIKQSIMQSGNVRVRKNYHISNPVMKISFLFTPQQRVQFTHFFDELNGDWFLIKSIYSVYKRGYSYGLKIRFISNYKIEHQTPNLSKITTTAEFHFYD